MKYSDGVAMLKDVTDWRAPREGSGVIILSPPGGGVPQRELRGESTPPSQSSLPPIATPGAQRARGYSGGVITSADCGPWVPPKPQGGLIVEGRWIDRPDALDASVSPADEAAPADAAPNRRARTR